MTSLVQNLLALLLALLTIAPMAYRLHKSGAFAPFLRWWRGLSRFAQSVALAFFLVIFAYGSNKQLGGMIGEGLRSIHTTVTTLCTNAFSSIAQLTGHAVSSVATNETHDFTMPEGAQLAERIARRGAHNDGFWLFDAFTNGIAAANPVWIQTDGTVTVKSPAPGIPIEELALYTTYSNITVYAPLQGSYGFLPASLWNDQCPSRIWTAVTDSGTRVITWENALLDRDPATPVSFQAEFFENGDVAYRYSPNPPLTHSSTSIGLFRNGTAQLLHSSTPHSSTSLATNDYPLTTIYWSYIGDLGDGTGDTDGDGLTDWQEIIQTHTDPHFADTDGDGLTDYDEVNGVTDPNNPDTDNDGIPDGQHIAYWATHPLWADATNANLTIRFADTNAAARAIVRVGDLAFFLCGTNAASLRLPSGIFYEIDYATTDGIAHNVEAIFGNPNADDPPMRGGAGESYEWFVDDPGCILSGMRTKRGHATVALVTLRLVPEGSTCVHDGAGCVFRVEMAPDDWQRAKNSADLDNLTLMDDGRLFLGVPATPGEYAVGSLTLGYPYLRNGVIGHTVSAHRCEGWSGILCPICGTYHNDGNSCDHVPSCGAGHSPPESCTCDPIAVPLNCDDDDGDGQEDRFRQSLSVDEDDCISFSPIRAGAAYCCCNVVSFSVRVNSVSGNLRLWDDSRLLGAGSVSDGGSWLVEGIATNTAGQTSHISYMVLDGDENEVATITRKFAVSPSLSFSFDPDSVLPDGKVVVVKRSTDPVRINNTTATVHATGLADGEYRLVADLAKFHLNNLTSTTVELDGGTSGSVELYGFSPSSAMGDATLSLQTVGGTTLCSTNFTVLWVDISMRCGQDEPFSTDNSCAAFTTNRILGTQRTALDGYEPSIGNVVEICGTVHPQDFRASIGFKRDNIAISTCVFTTNGIPVYRNVNQSVPRGLEPECNDDCRETCGDYNPLPNGHIYDVDTPGFPNYLLTAFPSGHYYLLRLNFAQYAVFNSRRCADDFFWFSRTTVVRALQNGHYVFEFLNRSGSVDDNVSGTGGTDVLW